MQLRELSRATSYAEERLELARRSGDSGEIGHALNSLASTAHAEGDYGRAKRLYRESIDLERSAGRTAVGSIAELAAIALEQGEFPAAVALSREAIDLFRQQQRHGGVCIASMNLACAQLFLGRLNDARDPLAETLKLADQLGWADMLGACFLAVSALGAMVGRRGDAGRLLEAAEHVFEELGRDLTPVQGRLRSIARDNLAERDTADIQTGRALSTKCAVELSERVLRWRPYGGEWRDS